MKARSWAACLVVFLVGCDRVPPASAGTANPAAISNLQPAESTEVAKLRLELDELKGKVQQIESERSLERLFDGSTAYLKVGEEGYSTVKFDLGVLTISLADIQPFANGSKATLKFGNTLSSDINGLQATIDWGRVDKVGLADNATQRSKEVTLSQTLRGGSWTSVEVVLDGIPSSELGFVRISRVSHRGIQLFSR